MLQFDTKPSFRKKERTERCIIIFEFEKHVHGTLLMSLALSDTSLVCSLDQKHNQECSSLLSSCLFGEQLRNDTETAATATRVTTENTPADNSFHVTF